ncbi:MAG: sporulation protein [Actinomycetales bacterium]|nr:sporulation protein [Actinomycetales bacterium]
MKLQELLARVGDHIGVSQVFGEPVEREGVTVVPVAVVAGGGGGGSGPDEAEVGGGFGVRSRGIGVYTIQDGRVRFVPAVDLVALGTLAVVMGCVLRGLLPRCRRRR